MQSIGGVADQLSGRLGGIGSQLIGGLQNAAGSLGQGVGDAIGGLLGLGQSDQAQQLNQLAQGGAIQGTDTLRAIAQGGGSAGMLNFQDLLEPGAQLEGQLGALDEAIQRNLGSTLDTLGGNAALAGGSGGSREQLFASRQAGDAQRAFASGASDLMANDLASRRGLAATAGNMALQQQAQQAQAGQALAGLGLQQTQQQAGILDSLLGRQAGAAIGAGQLGIGQQGAQTGAASAGLGNLGNLFNLGMSPFQAQFQPLANFASILGGPTVLSQSRQDAISRSRAEQSSSGSSKGGSAGFSILGG